MQVYNINDIAAQAEKPRKISEPGIYAGVKITKVEMKDNIIDFEFLTDDNKYTDLRIYTDCTKDWTGKALSVEDQVKMESKKIGKLVEIAASVGSLTDINPTGTYTELVVKLIKYIETKMSKALVNIKVLLDQKGEWARVCGYNGGMEKYVSGNDPKLFFTNREIDDKLNVRTSSPSTSSSTSTSSTYSAPADSSMPF